MRIRRAISWIAVIAAALLPAACTPKMYDPGQATRAYPRNLHTTQTVDMQVFRRDTDIEIVNTTATSYADFDLWINRRYVRHVDALPAGKTITLSLWDFHDEFGDRFNAGGFFREYEPTPVRLVQIQPTADQPLVGLISIRIEDVKLPPEPGG